MAAKSYTWKFTAFVQIVVLVGLIALGVVSYRSLTGLIEKEMGMRARGVALAASLIIQDDMTEYLQLKSTADEKKPYYLKMKKFFQSFKATNNLRYMYTEKKISQDKIIYILDAEPSDSEYTSHVGDEDKMNALRRIAYASQRPEYGPLTVDPEWGVFITGYAPLFNPVNHEFVGLIGVDIEAAEVYELFREIKSAIVITIIIVFLISFIITYRWASQMVRPIYIDGLLGIYNHKYFQQSLAKEISRTDKNHDNLALLIIDLDNFKNINDTYGHSFGDDILKATTKILKGSLRKKDTLARYGGEEFGVILPETNLEEAYRIASLLRERMEQHSVYNEDTKQDVTVTISIGLAEWQPGIDRNELIKRADKAMYQSKERQRNTVTVFQGSTEVS